MDLGLQLKCFGTLGADEMFSSTDTILPADQEPVQAAAKWI